MSSMPVFLWVHAHPESSRQRPPHTLISCVSGQTSHQSALWLRINTYYEEETWLFSHIFGCTSEIISWLWAVETGQWMFGGLRLSARAEEEAGLISSVMLLSCSFLFTSCVCFGVSSLHFLVSHFLSPSFPVTVIVRPSPSSLTCVPCVSGSMLRTSVSAFMSLVLGSVWVLFNLDPFWTCSPPAGVLPAWPLVTLVTLSLELMNLWHFWARLFIKWCMKVTTGTHPLRVFSVVNTFRPVLTAVVRTLMRPTHDLHHMFFALLSM